MKLKCQKMEIALDAKLKYHLILNILYVKNVSLNGINTKILNIKKSIVIVVEKVMTLQ
jgi:hypothetical protein